MLTGQNGILTNARNSNSSSVYYGAEEQVKLCYMAVITEIMTQKVANSTYDATDNAGKLAKIVKDDLSGSEWAVTPTTESATGDTITITYTNSKIYKDTIATGKPSQNGQVEYTITLEEQNAKLTADGVEVNGGTADSGTGGVTGVDFGSKTASTIEAGENLTIGTESFRVLSKSSSQIIAVPFYNITLVTPEENSGAYPEQTDATSGNTTDFSTEAYWTQGTDTIDMTDSRNKIQKYITAYSTKLSNATGGKVTARVARYSEMNASGVTNAMRNPGELRFYWTGSGAPYNADSVRVVVSLPNNYSYKTEAYDNAIGVRPVIVISLS